MNDAKMCQAMQSICMGKRNYERLRHVFVKDGRMYATDNYMVVAVQDKFTESHGHDGIEVLKRLFACLMLVFACSMLADSHHIYRTA